MRAAYEAELPKRGWIQGERTLSTFFRENGPELRIQMAHVPKTPRTSPPAAK